MGPQRHGGSHDSKKRKAAYPAPCISRKNANRDHFSSERIEGTHIMMWVTRDPHKQWAGARSGPLEPTAARPGRPRRRLAQKISRVKGRGGWVGSGVFTEAAGLLVCRAGSRGAAGCAPIKRIRLRYRRHHRHPRSAEQRQACRAVTIPGLAAETLELPPHFFGKLYFVQ